MGLKCANGKNKASTKLKNGINVVKLKNAGRSAGGVKTGGDGNSNTGGGGSIGREGEGRFKLWVPKPNQKQLMYYFYKF